MEKETKIGKKTRFFHNKKIIFYEKKTFSFLVIYTSTLNRIQIEEYKSYTCKTMAKSNIILPCKTILWSTEIGGSR